MNRFARLLLSTPLALIFVVSVRVVRPFFVVRIGAMRSDRIGHFVLETDLMLLEQASGISTKPKRSVDIGTHPSQSLTEWYTKCGSA